MIRTNGQDETMLRGVLAVGLRALPGHLWRRGNTYKTKIHDEMRETQRHLRTMPLDRPWIQVSDGRGEFCLGKA